MHSNIDISCQAKKAISNLDTFMYLATNDSDQNTYIRGNKNYSPSCRTNINLKST